MSFLNKRKNKDIVPRRRTGGINEISDNTSASGMRTSPFGRNRTITGTRSNVINVSNLNKPGIDSDRSHAHNLAKKRRKVLYILGISISAIVFIYWVLVQFTAVVRITSSDASISAKIDSSVYVKSIEDYLGLHPLERFRFALNKNNLVGYISSTLPDVDNISRISNDGVGATSYNLVFRRGVASWSIENKKYFVDSRGVAFESNYYDDKTVEIVDQSGISVQGGVTIASNKFLGFVGKTVSMATSRGYDVTQAIIPSDTTRQLQIHIKGVVPFVKLSIDRPVGEQIEDMDKSIKYLSSRGQSPAYIDVRVSGKAFYR